MVEGWYGAEVVCQIPFVFTKSLNSALVNTDPLSDTSSSDALSREDRPEFSEDSSRGSVSYSFHLHPLRVGIYYNQEHVSEKRANVVDVQPSR